MEKLLASDYLTREERKMLMEKNDFKGAIEVIGNWLWIVAVFALVYFYPNVWTILIALFVLGGKQLACAILMHDASHHALFSSPKMNDFVGKWFGSYPIFQDMLKYRP